MPRRAEQVRLDCLARQAQHAAGNVAQRNDAGRASVAKANRRRVFKIVGIVVGATVGVIAYLALMTFLALLAAGMRL